MTVPVDAAALAALRSITDPYRREGERLGFSVVEENAHWWDDPSPGGWGSVVFLYRQPGVFLDVHAVVAKERMPRGVIAGFNGVQLYSFVQKPDLAMVITNGSPEIWKRGVASRLLERMLPTSDENATVYMETPSDLQKVITAHAAKLRADRELLVPAGPHVLEQRWRWCDDLGLNE